MSYAYKRTFTVDHTKVGSSDSSAFPVLICGTITEFKTAANGGHIQHTVSFNGVTVPADICFYSDSGLTTAIPFEISSYSASTGTIVIWVKRNLSHTADTAIYCAYDDSGVTTYQGGAVGDAWDSNYVAVYHLGDGTTLSLKDSTANGRNLTNTGSNVTAGSGPTSPLGAAAFNGSNTDLVTSAFTLGETTALTVSFWYKNVSNTANGMYVEKSTVNSSWEVFQESGSIKLRGGNTGSDVASNTFPSQAAWHSIVAVISSSTSGALYSDGSANGSATVDTLGDTSTALHLGNYDNSGYFFNGSLSCIRISKTARSTDWITAAYNNQSSPGTFYSDSGESSNSSGTNYTQSFSASTASFAATATRIANKSLSGSSSLLSGSIAKQPAKGLVASCASFSGLMAKRTGKGTAASCASFSGLMAKRTGKGTAASCAAFSGAVAKQCGKSISSVSNTFAGALTRVAQKSLAAAASSFAGSTLKKTGHAAVAAMSQFAGAVTRQVNKGLSAANSTWSAAFSGIHVILVSFSATMATFSGTAFKQTRKSVLSSTAAFGGSAAKSISKSFGAATAAWSAVCSTGNRYFASFSAAMNVFAAGIARQTGKSIASSQAGFSGGVARRTAHSMAASCATFAAKTNKQTNVALAALQAGFSVSIGTALSHITAAIDWLKAILGISKPEMLATAASSSPAMMATAVSVTYGATNG